MKNRPHIAPFLLQERVWMVAETMFLAGWGTRHAATFLLRMFPELSNRYEGNPHAREHLARLLRYHMQDKLTYDRSADPMSLPEEVLLRHGKFMKQAQEQMPKEPSETAMRAAVIG